MSREKTRDRKSEGPVRRRLRNFRRDESAAVSLIAVATIFVVLAVATIVIDAGSILFARRTLQNATDAAALSAVQHLDNAQSTALQAMVENEYSEENLTSVEIGAYDSDPDSGKAPRDRFSALDAGDPSVNAVRVSATAQAPTYFARVFGASNFSVVSTEATAAITPTVAFGAGTQLAKLDSGAINTILGGLLGTTVTLSAIDYNALANAQVSALDFMTQLATTLNLSSASTYGDLLNAHATVGQIIDATAAVLQRESGGSHVSVALSALNILAGRVPSGTGIRVGDVIDASYLEKKDVGTGGGSASLSALDILEASIGSASTGKTIGVGLNIPGLTSAKLAIGAPMRFTVGPVGTSIHTAQVRLILTLNATISIPLVLPATGITVPVYIESAEGTVTATSIPCQPGNMAVLEGTTGGVKASFASVSNQALVDFSQNPTPGAATIQLAGFNLITVGGSATIASNGPIPKSFTAINQTQEISGTGSGASLFSDLNQSLTVTPNIPLVTPLLKTTISGLLQTVSAALLPALSALGVSLGNLDMTLAGAKCTPSLVG